MVGKPRTWSIVAIISAVAFGLVLWSVLARAGLTVADPSVATWVAGHRPGWLTPVMQLVTWLGSSFFIIPFGLAVGAYLRLRRDTWRPLAGSRMFSEAIRSVLPGDFS